MLRNFLRSKIHGVRVTEANLRYVGSLSIDGELLELASIEENEVVHLANLTNGERLTTYAIRAPRGSRTISANGAAAHKVRVGDQIIIFSFALLNEEERLLFTPKLVFVDEANNPIPARSTEQHGELTGASRGAR